MDTKDTTATAMETDTNAATTTSNSEQAGLESATTNNEAMDVSENSAASKSDMETKSGDKQLQKRADSEGQASSSYRYINVTYKIMLCHMFIIIELR